MSVTPIEELQSKPIAGLLTLQTAKMVETATSLEQAMLFLLAGDFQNMQAPVTTISRLEKECDRIKEVLSEKLVKARSPPLPVTKADFLKVIRIIDGVVNQADIIAHRLLLYELKVSPSLVPLMKDLVKHSTKSVGHLRDAVDDLSEDLKKAITDATLAEDERRDARDTCWTLLRDIYHTLTDPITIVLTRELILGVTRLADVVERCSDFIVKLAITYSRIS